MLTRHLHPFGTFGILLIPQFPIYVLTLIIEPLRLANKYLGSSVYEWRIFSMDGAPAAAANGVSVAPEGDVTEMEGLGNICVLSGYQPEQAYTRAVFSKLQYLERLGTRIGGIDTGVFVLAEAGLLNECPATVHWEAISSFQEAFPQNEITDALFTISANRFTCAGGAVTLDLMLNLIARDQGDALAQKVAQDFVHDNIRVASENQRIAQDNRWQRYNPDLANIIKAMEENIEEPLSIQDLMSMTGRSRRQLERVFRRNLGTTPMRHYLQIRLKKAQQLVKYSALPIRTIALSCGFSSMSTFSRSYHRSVGITARNHRTLFQTQGTSANLPKQKTTLDISTASRK